jgi:alkyl hydroperoxide reductase subunit AhpC
LLRVNARRSLATVSPIRIEEVTMGTLNAVVGTRAPSFSVSCVDGSSQDPRPVSLDDYLDRWLVMIFYPRDFSLVCPTELTAVSGRIAEFHDRRCEVLGISTDSAATHQRWLTTPPGQGGVGPLRFPLASDEDGSVARAYGVHVEGQNLALRGLFLIDPNGVLQYQVVHSLSVGRSTEEILRVLDGLQMGGLCAGERKQGEPTLDVVRELTLDRVLGHYRIEAKLGNGSFGTIYRARDLTLERTVALKIIRPDGPLAPEALLAEARAAAALTHPNVCVIHAVDSSLGPPMIVMEYVDGEPLSRRLRRARLLPEEATALGRQVAMGMAAAHAQGVVHGDLKPANVLITPAGTAKIVDFGIARRDVGAGVGDQTALWNPVRSGGITGTPAYMAPEQAQGQPPTQASDVFSLGLILYEMATGRRARADGNMLQLLRLIDDEDPAEYASQSPESFAGILRQALATDPAQRRISMAQIANRLGERLMGAQVCSFQPQRHPVGPDPNGMSAAARAMHT